MITKGPIRIEADYLIETAIDPMQAAEIMAGEQSSGTFRPVPAETPELKLRAAARCADRPRHGDLAGAGTHAARLPGHDR